MEKYDIESDMFNEKCQNINDKGENIKKKQKNIKTSKHEDLIKSVDLEVDEVFNNKRVSIRIKGGPNQFSNSNVTPLLLDEFDGSTEDAFSLESFTSMIINASKRKKAFIISRVVTVDTNNNKYYNSYYQAHSINKVIFRTEPEKKLLHRIKAKNPLNNMFILGRIYYYVIMPETVSCILKKLYKSNENSIKDEESNKELSTSLCNNPINRTMSDVRYISGEQNEPYFSIKHRKKHVRSFSCCIIKMENEENSSLMKCKYDEHHNEKIENLVETHINEPEKNSKTRTIITTDRSRRKDLERAFLGMGMTSKESLLLKNSNVEQFKDDQQLRNSTNNLLLDTISNEKDIVFDLNFFATDDDYLFNEEVRNFFKNNSTDPNDNKLYNIQDILSRRSFYPQSAATTDHTRSRVQIASFTWNGYRKEILYHPILAATFHLTLILSLTIPIIFLFIFPMFLSIIMAISLFIVIFLTGTITFIIFRQRYCKRQSNIISNESQNV